MKTLVCAGTSTPPSIAATPVPALPPPIAVNSYASVPAPPSGQSATDALYTNGVHAYQGTAPPPRPQLRLGGCWCHWPHRLRLYLAAVS